MLWLIVGAVGTIFAILLIQSVLMYEASGENDEMEDCVDGEDEIL